MSDLVLSNITSGYNLSLINSNFQAIQDKINNFCLQTSQGDNVMSQDLDMNSHSILNLTTNFSNNGSMLTVGDAKSHFYQIGLIPTTTNNGDAVSYGQVGQMIAASSAGTDPANVALYSVLGSTSSGSGASLIGFADASNLYTATTVEGALEEAQTNLNSHISNLANSSGSNLVGFLQVGTSTVQRTAQDKMRDEVNLKDFGAKCDGTTDDTVAFQNALSSISARGGGTLFLPAGSIKVGAITLPTNVSIKGSGKYSTWIIPVAAQTCFTLNGAGAQIQQTYSEFGIYCGSTANVNGFKFVNCYNIGIYHIAFKGCLSNFEIDQGYWIDIDGCDSIGTPVLKAGSCKIWSSDDTKYVFQVGLRRYSINNIGNGVQGPAVYIRRAIAAQLSQVNCNDANIGGTVDFIVIENDCQGCKVFESGVGASAHGILVQQGSGPTISPSFLDIVSCDIDQAQSGSITINNGYSINIIGGNLTTSGVGTTASALLISRSTSVRVQGVTINGFNGTNGVGIYVDGSGGTSYVELRDNHIENCYFGFTVANSPTYVTAYNNTLRGCTNSINGSIGGTGNSFARNQGLNPVSVTTPTMPASGTFITNTTGVRCTVYVYGGTVSVIYINGGAGGIATSSLSYDLEPGETTAISYSATPNWRWIGH